MRTAIFESFDAARRGWAACLDLGRYRVLSLSPELFFERRGETLIARPMKGTLIRGRWMEEDVERAGRLAACPKNRAENVMIVDLLRNDLGKISRPGSVWVPRLFKVKRYETLLQTWGAFSGVCTAYQPFQLWRHLETTTNSSQIDPRVCRTTKHDSSCSNPGKTPFALLPLW